MKNKKLSKNALQKKLLTEFANKANLELYRISKLQAAKSLFENQADFAYLSMSISEHEEEAFCFHISLFNKEFTSEISDYSKQCIYEHMTYYDANKHLHPIWPVLVLHNYKFEETVHVFPCDDISQKRIYPYDKIQKLYEDIINSLSTLNYNIKVN